MIIIGSSLLQQANGGLLYSAAVNLSNSLLETPHDWKVLNVLHRVASQVGALDVGYKPGIGDLNGTRLLFLLGAVSNLLHAAY